MKILIFLVCFLVLAVSVRSQKKVVCYYDTSRNAATDNNYHFFRLSPRFLKPALDKCTHLVYGFAPINTDTNSLMDLDPEYVPYTNITEFKNENLEVLLSIGGDNDDDDTDEYFALLESQDSRQELIDSAINVMLENGFDGIDIYWPFPKIEPEPEVIPIKTNGNGLSLNLGFRFGGNVNIGGGKSPIPVQVQLDPRGDFAAFVREFRESINQIAEEEKQKFLLSMTVAPNVDYAKYCDVSSISQNVDFINLAIYDFVTPDRFPTTTGYIAPIYQPPNLKTNRNYNDAVSYWLKNGAPKNKIVLAIPPYGRSWKLDPNDNKNRRNSSTVRAMGPTDITRFSKIPGLLTYSEVCTYVYKGSRANFETVQNERYGSYAYSYCIPSRNGSCSQGLWVSYVGPLDVIQKARYVISKRLGGMAIMDLSYDDFHALCPVKPRTEYPILGAVYKTLSG